MDCPQPQASRSASSRKNTSLLTRLKLRQPARPIISEARPSVQETTVAQMIVPHVATHGLFVDGRWIEEGDIVEIKAPFDGAVIGRVHQGKRKHAEAAIAAAVKAFGTTRRLRSSSASCVNVDPNFARHRQPQRRVFAHARAGSWQADQSCPHRSRPRGLHFHGCGRRECAHLR